MSDRASNRGIPRGIEVLIKKAKVDAAFRELLLHKRAEAAGEIGLTLDPAEAMMLNGVPQGQLEAIIERTRVSPRLRKVFLGGAAAVMLAALGAAVVGCERWPPPTTGERPDLPEPPPAASEPGP